MERVREERKRRTKERGRERGREKDRGAKSVDYSGG